MKRELRNSLTSYLVELCVYAVLVVAYYFLVLHLLGGWLHRLFVQNPRVYAGVALGLIVGQGLLLEALTRLLLALVKLPRERP
jgi:hypothetical protein